VVTGVAFNFNHDHTATIDIHSQADSLPNVIEAWGHVMDTFIAILVVVGFVVIVGAPTFIREFNKAKDPNNWKK
jgi:hypothetical protein